MVKLVALKRLRYPRGPSGKEYVAGETFEALSEKDAHTLKLVRIATEPKDYVEPPKAEPRPPAPQPPTPEPVPEPPPPQPEPQSEEEYSEPEDGGPVYVSADDTVEPLTTQATIKKRRTYKRRDMKAEED